MVFGNGVKNIQAAAYNGARTVDVFESDQAQVKLSSDTYSSDSAPDDL